jgi:hypothetical protein
MPRGSKPGERRGGRQRGTPNKKTALRKAALAAAAANPDISPRDFLLAAMRDATTPGDRRVKIALVLVRQTNENPASAHRHRPTQSGELIDGASSLVDAVVANALREDYHRLTEFQKSVHPGRRDKLSPAEIEEESTLRARIADRAREIGCSKGYGPKQERNDESRLHALHCKRISPPCCGGGTLSADVSAEEAQLLARTLAFRESPEGLARRRILELRLATFSRGPTPAEQDELDRLLKLYPDVPLDDDDPLKKALEAWGGFGTPNTGPRQETVRPVLNSERSCSG